MSYVVLARRWRSKHFDEVVGQEHVARTLCNAIEQDRVAHAFLFCGPRGVGKTSSARIMAKALNCAQGPTTRPCYQCPSCLEISDGSSMDVFEIDGASNRGVNEIRELREGVRYAPGRDRYKIYIIDEVHMLTTEAFNALLKTLEEPPPHVKFIFATTEPQKIPVTILSRCQRFDFKRISSKRIAEHLAQITQSEGITAEPGALALISRQADGCMRDALSLTDQVISFCDGQSIQEQQVAQILGVAGRDTLFALTEALFSKHVEAALRVLDKINSAGYDISRFAGALVEHLRDLTVIKVSQSPDGLTELTPDELSRAHAQVEPIDLSVLNRMFNITVNTVDTMSRSAFPRLVFEMTIVKLSAIEPLLPMELILKRLEALESGLQIGPGPGSPPSPPSTAGSGGGRQQAPNTHTASPPKAQAPDTSSARSAPSPPTPKASPYSSSTQDETTVSAAQPPAQPPQRQEHEVILPKATLPNTLIPLRSLPEKTSQGQLNGANGHLRLVDGVNGVNHTNDDAARSAPQINGTAHSDSASTAGDVTAVGDGITMDRAREHWRAVVNTLRGQGKLVSAGVYEQARLLKLGPGEIHLIFDDALDSIAKEHRALLEAAAQKQLRSLWDGAWSVTLAFSSEHQAPTSHAQRSLAQEQEELRREMLQRAKEQISKHKLVTQALSIFTPDKVWVVLDEDDHLPSSVS